MKELLKEKFILIRKNFVPSLITSLLTMGMCAYIMAVLLKNTYNSNYTIIKSIPYIDTELSPTSTYEAIQTVIQSPVCILILLLSGLSMFLLTSLLD
ncbi:hypothetical protein RM611_11185 [Staphylococcus chromogenes]|uniref:hypothetical protein n=1 Tax=Staphylococcus chromogenes TaxID=46126 RepID=UPI002884E76E|nr:hypothetical protein [Staphylococcus chromogenes]MDT0694153.1 hypothetical protein [Staphylococcus chromogenes]